MAAAVALHLHGCGSEDATVGNCFVDSEKGERDRSSRAAHEHCILRSALARHCVVDSTGILY